MLPRALRHEDLIDLHRCPLFHSGYPSYLDGAIHFAHVKTMATLTLSRGRMAAVSDWYNRFVPFLLYSNSFLVVGWELSHALDKMVPLLLIGCLQNERYIPCVAPATGKDYRARQWRGTRWNTPRLW